MLAWGSRARRLPAGRRARYGPVRQRETRNPPVAAGHARPGVIQEVFLHGVLVELGDGAQPPGERGASAAFRFRVASEAFDVGAADGEQGERASKAPVGELP